MRVTNNMITENSKRNINSNKVMVDKYNTQMTTQKKIAKASEDPVIAIRSLRMETTMSHINQYLDNNITDVEAWLDVTGTALINMKSILTDIRTQCVNGANDTLTEDDRQTILKSLSSLADQIYTEGNSDYAGRTVFTGYRTGSKLTFMEDEQETTYEIDQTFSYTDLHDHRYYYGSAEVPADADTECTTEIGTQTYSRLRLAYGETDAVGGAYGTDGGYEAGYAFSYSYTSDDGTAVTVEKTMAAADEAGDGDIKVYENEEEWYEATGDMSLGDDEIIYIRSTGEFVFGDSIAHTLAQNECTIDVTYTKTGFDEGEARPEYYYDCRKYTPDLAAQVSLVKENQQINFTISDGITIPANTQASEVFDTSIGRDVSELIDIVNEAISAHDKVDRITEMMNREQYSSEEDQATLQGWLDAAQKEADYADDNLQKTYSQYITNFDNYLEDVNIAITNVGSLEKRLELTKTRVENQKMTVEELQSNNEDRCISDIVIDYYAAYNAYTASLMATSKLNEQTLLSYL